MMDCLHSKYKYREIVFFGTDNKLTKSRIFCYNSYRSKKYEEDKNIKRNNREI